MFLVRLEHCLLVSMHTHTLSLFPPLLGSPFTVNVDGHASNRLRESITRERRAADVARTGSPCELLLKIPGRSAHRLGMIYLTLSTVRDYYLLEIGEGYPLLDEEDL